MLALSCRRLMRLPSQNARPCVQALIHQPMFNPSQDEVRRFFCEVWTRQKAGQPLTPLQALAGGWIDQHPEYQHLLANADEAVSLRFDADSPAGNPFLHLAMHLAIAEQLSIDQPPGIRDCFQQLADRAGSAHEAAHETMECLGEVLWKAQRSGGVPDGQQYVECLRQRASS